MLNVQKYRFKGNGITSDDQVFNMVECLPNGRKTQGLLQVMRAPYQRPEAHPTSGDLLFLWIAMQ